MTDALAAIRKRHSDIPQDALPLEIPDTGLARQGESGKASKSVDQAVCPWHVAKGDDDTTGLIRTSTFSLVFREHTRRVGKTTMRCPGSGRSPLEAHQETETA